MAGPRGPVSLLSKPLRPSGDVELSRDEEQQQGEATYNNPAASPPLSSPTRPPAPWAGELELLRDSPSKAFECYPKVSDGSRSFLSPETLISSGQRLGEGVEVIEGKDPSLCGISIALFGPSSTFQRQLSDAKDPQILTPSRPKAASWCLTSVSKFNISIPVLGQRPFQEDFRVAHCLFDGAPALMVQLSSKCAVGFPVGDLVTEALHIFSSFTAEGTGDEAIHLRSYGWAAPGSQQRKALQGLVDGRGRFVQLVQDTLQP